MPRKIRQLVADLRRAGFVQLRGRGKGDHQMWQHPDVPAAIVGLDGRDGDDAKRYMETNLRKAIAQVQQTLAAREAERQREEEQS
ncbi:MAG TPA: type II toxin-antitoxin system HicA family toxin [Thermomicrobiales bacterium]|nr:type II toxin-antitoxin system HicA family toxin [Thermomicrobiales bacterium]